MLRILLSGFTSVAALSGVGRVPSTLAGATEPTSHFFEFATVGGLTNMMECVVNSAILCQMLNLTLVTPAVDVGWEQQTKVPLLASFSALWDFDQFKSGVAPLSVSSAAPGRLPAVRLPPPPSDLRGIVALSDWWAPIVKGHSVSTVFISAMAEHNPWFLENIGFRTYESRFVDACSADYAFCSQVHRSLTFNAKIRQAAAKIVQELGSNWSAVHVHDYKPFLASHELREELSALSGVLSNVRPSTLYVLGGQSAEVACHPAFSAWRVVSKETYLPELSLLPKSEQAAVDFEVARFSSVYVEKPGSSFDAYLSYFRAGRRTLKLPGTCESERVCPGRCDGPRCIAGSDRRV